jgi:hypothetical protein
MKDTFVDPDDILSGGSIPNEGLTLRAGMAYGYIIVTET